LPVIERETRKFLGLVALDDLHQGAWERNLMKSAPERRTPLKLPFFCSSHQSLTSLADHTRSPK